MRVEKPVTISLKIPSVVDKQMNLKLLQAGYGLRGKSRWIVDALKLFFAQKLEFCLEAIEIADELEQLEKSISFRTDRKTEVEIQKLIGKIRSKKPLVEGLKSKIIRAAICQGLIRESLSLR